MKKLTIFISIFLPITFTNAKENNPCPAIENIKGITHKGLIEVPEDYDNLNGKKIKVFYYARIEEGKTPVVFINGGPGGVSHYSAEDFENEENSSAKKFSFVYFDQRGTGCSDQFPEDANEGTLQRLKKYGAENIARDAEAIRKKLLGENGKWKVMGHSYGSLIAQQYIKIAPENLLTVHGLGWAPMNNQVDFMRLRIKSQRKVIEEYFKIYPEDRDKIIKLKNAIKDADCFTQNDFTVCGNKVVDALAITLGSRESWTNIHRYFEIFKIDENGHAVLSTMEKYVLSYVHNFFRHTGFGARAVLPAYDLLGGFSHREACILAERKLLRQNEFPNEWYLNECNILKAVADPKWEKLIRKTNHESNFTPYDMIPSLKRYPDLKFYLYAGSLDSKVPPESFRDTVKALKHRVTYTVIPNQGHNLFYSKEIWLDMMK